MQLILHKRPGLRLEEAAHRQDEEEEEEEQDGEYHHHHDCQQHQGTSQEDEAMIAAVSAERERLKADIKVHNVNVTFSRYIT